MRDPSEGARLREGLLLGAYAVLLGVGVWTVVVAELSSQDPATAHPQVVTETTEKPPPSGN